MTARPPPRPALAQRAARALLRAAGWRLAWAPLPAARGIVVVYPHTSNWDFPIGLLFKIAVGLPARWVGKDSLFRWPFRGLLIRLGGIPVNRRERTGFVDSLLAQYSSNERLWLAMAPEGTRSYTDHWKSGFYQLAVAASLPVGLGFIDYATRTVGIDTYAKMSGDPVRDLATIRAFYVGKRGRRPALAGEIRLRG
ncbi:MAG: 1-acyl-sn-glycerol-3-phosphate acyltransferase [Proteobacteria bacterium]|nr:1-acyl-sn-glycerol-3-phosphate acyltransferase [Pseudomonadota bacterium]